MDKQIIAIETPLYLFPFIRLTRTLCIDLNILNLCLNIDTVQFLYNAIGMDNVVNELYYKGTISQRNYRKMTISWSFSYNSFVKFHDKKIWKPQNDRIISKSVVYRGTL